MEEPKEYHLIMEFVFDVRSKVPLKKFKFPVQNYPFRCGIRIRNNGNNVFAGAIFKDFQIRPVGENKYLTHDFQGEFNVGTLNPGDEETIWFGKLNTFLEGLIWVSCNIEPNIPTEKIITYQKERNTGQVLPYKGINQWGVEEFIQSQSQVQTARTNFLLVTLTALIFLEGLWGIGNVIASTRSWLSDLFLFLSKIL